jgi:hypothetical protein
MERLFHSWPFSVDLAKLPKPFILQHALKDLLLAAPVDWFNRFAALLGFDELTQVHKDLMAFCTKPPLPPAAKSFIADIDSLFLKVESEPQLCADREVNKKRLLAAFFDAFLIEKHAQHLAGSKTAKANLLAALIKQRDDLISNVFRGTVAVTAFTADGLQQLGEDETALLARVTSEATSLFTTLMSEAVQHRILQEATFYGLGIELLKNDKERWTCLSVLQT